VVVDELDEVTYDLVRLDERIWRAAREEGISRRRFLELVGLGGAGVLLGACTHQRVRPGGATRAPGTSGTTAAATNSTVASPIVKPLPADKFLLHSGPEIGNNAEMRWEQMTRRGYLAGNDLFFVRNSTVTPRIDPATWNSPSRARA
jgi:hypothetical protein